MGYNTFPNLLSPGNFLWIAKLTERNLKTTWYEPDYFQIQMSKLFLSTWSDNEIHEDNVFSLYTLY